MDADEDWDEHETALSLAELCCELDALLDAGAVPPEHEPAVRQAASLLEAVDTALRQGV